MPRGRRGLLAEPTMMNPAWAGAKTCGKKTCGKKKRCTSGVLTSRAVPIERAIAWVCQEAGARVGRNVALSAMNLNVLIHDSRRIEVVCNSLPLWHGAQLAVDASREGRPHPGTETQPGAAVRAAARCKRRLTLSLTAPGDAAWLSAETRGWWAFFLRLLARACASATPAVPRPAAQAAWVLRWSGLIAVAAQRACSYVPGAATADRALCCRTGPGSARGKPGHSLAAALPARSCG